jgi:hypothetical protein
MEVLRITTSRIRALGNDVNQQKRDNTVQWLLFCVSVRVARIYRIHDCIHPRVQRPCRHSDNVLMDINYRSLIRMTNISHLLTVLVLTAVLAVFLIPLSGRPTARRTAGPTEVRRESAHSETGASVSEPLSAATTVPTTTPTTTAVPTPTTPPTTTPPAPALDVAAAAAVPSGYGCAAALAYLRAHAAPGFALECPGWADGHQAMSCDNVAGICPGAKVIAISIPCPAAYMNEASNSWVLLGESHNALDPYGYCL